MAGYLQWEMPLFDLEAEQVQIYTQCFHRKLQSVKGKMGSVSFVYWWFIFQTTKTDELLNDEMKPNDMRKIVWIVWSHYRQ